MFDDGNIKHKYEASSGAKGTGDSKLPPLTTTITIYESGTLFLEPRKEDARKNQSCLTERQRAKFSSLLSEAH